MTIKDSGVCSTYLDPWLSFVCEVEDDVIRKIWGMLDTCPKFSSINQGRLTPAISLYRCEECVLRRTYRHAQPAYEMLRLVVWICFAMYGHLLAKVLNVLFAILCLVFPITITFFYPSVSMGPGAIMLGLT